jgi:hypothetical protein
VKVLLATRELSKELCIFSGQLTSALLVENRVSDNVGGANSFWAYFRMQSEKSAISLSMEMADPTKARVVILSGQETRSDPRISSVPDYDHDY